MTTVINSGCMHKGYSSHSVCLCVSVTDLAASYLGYTMKIRCH